MHVLKGRLGSLALMIFLSCALPIRTTAQVSDQSSPAPSQDVTAPVVAPITPQTITPDESNANVQAEPGAAAGVNPWLNHLADKLGLTPEQVTQAQAIFSQVHGDMKAQFSQVREQIRSVLTPEQQATFDSLPHPLFVGRMHGPGGPGGPGEGGGEAQHLQRLSAELGLTPDQQTSIKTIWDNVRTAIQNRRSAAQEQFQALLTADQLAKLNSNAAPGTGGAQQAGEHHMFGALAQLGLTPEQHTQARAIFQQMRTDVKNLRDEAHAQVRSLLTDAQQAKFDSLKPPARAQNAAVGAGSGAPGVPQGHWHHGAAMGRMDSAQREQVVLGRLTQELGLTDAQRTSIQGIFDNLHTTLQAAHATARSQFRALLTTEQAASLDQLKAAHGQPAESTPD